MPVSKDDTKLLDSKPLACFFAQTGFSTAFACLTSGVFLSGLAILMGAGDTLVSYLSVIVNVCGVLVLFFSLFLERFESRKRLAITLTVLSRLVTVFLAVVPALFPAGQRLPVFIPLVVLAFTLQAQTTVVVNQWMLHFVDGARSGRFVSLRQTLVIAVNVVLPIVGGSWMDRMGGRYEGFALIFAAAAVMGAVELVLLARTPDGPLYRSGVQRYRLRDMVAIPLRDRAFARFVLYVFVFYLLLYIADSFTMLYMMKYLALPYQTVTLLYTIISLPQLVLLGAWGRLSDRKGHAFALRLSIWLFMGETFFMFLAGPNTWFIFIPVAFLVSSLANSGFSIAVFNRRYELMPKENRIVYDNFFTAAVGLAFILGPMLGGAVKGLLEGSGMVAQLMPLAEVRLLYPIACVGILLLQLVRIVAERKKK